MLHGDVLGDRARLTPGKLALVDVATGARLTYAELDARATRTARWLREGLGLAKGERFGLLAHNRVEFLDIFFAAAKSGCIIVPLGTRLTAHELEHIVRDSGVRALIYAGQFSDTVMTLRTLVPIERAIALDEPAVATDAHYGALLDALPDDPAWQREPCGGEDVYALLYTSGTTGRPKGVMIPHRMVAWNGYNTAACWQLEADDVSPIFTPLYHAGALGAFLLPIVTIGGTIVLHAGFDLDEVWRVLVQERCTVVLGVPTIWKLLMDAPQFATADLSHVRWFISGGAPLPEYIAEAFQQRGVTFKQGYGLTEVGVNCFSMTVDESIRKRGSIGRPLMQTQATLIDEAGAAVGRGDVGELCLRGPHVSLGYWNNPEATAAALDAAGWFHTGDLARQDADGFFYIAGRRKDMFISGGVNVYPAEIEGELLLHPSVADAAVVGIPHATWGEVGVAFVVARTGHALDAAAVLAHLEPRLARYKLPTDIVFVEALPRTAYGKVQKHQLTAQYRQQDPPRHRSLVAVGLQADRRRRVVRDGPVLAHLVEGAGTPCLLLNGGLMSIRAWDPIAAPLVSRHRVIRCDLRGQLLSPGPVPSTLEGHADEIVRMLDAIGVDRVHLAGTSLGAFVATVTASRHPDRVRSLVAMTAADRITDQMWQAAIPVRAAARDTANGGDGGRVLDLLGPATFSEGYLARFAAEFAQRRAVIASLPRAWFAALDGLLAPLEGLDMRPYAASVACPVLVVGGEHDRTFPLAHSHALCAAFPAARLHVVAGGAHGLIIEQPDEVVDLLTKFWRGIDAG